MENKKDNSNLAAGASAVAGATVGAVAGMAATSSATAGNSQNNVAPDEVEVVETTATDHNTYHAPATHTAEPTSYAESKQDQELGSGGPGMQHTASTHHSGSEHHAAGATHPVSHDEEPELEVLSYERFTTDEGDTVDAAVLNIDGEIRAVFDVDLDGEADLLVGDYNNNGHIEEDEMVDISGSNIDMHGLRMMAQETVGIDDTTTPLYANNDIVEDTDYINDANVDDYLA